MDNVLNSTIQNDDENACDEFSASEFFKRKRFGLRDITNEHLSINSLPKPIINKNADKNDFNDVTKITKKSEYVKEFLSNKRKISELCDDYERKYVTHDSESLSAQMSNFVSYQNRFYIDPIKIKVPLLDSLSELNDNDNTVYLVALTTPSNGYNNKYSNYIVVPEPCKDKKLLKIDHKSALWNTMMITSKVELRILSTPCRNFCSPIEEYSLTPILQYRSHCLIQKYHVTDMDLFTEAIAIDGVNKISHEHPNQIHSFMPESVNISHFHELYLEKLPCNQLFDFMPLNSDLTGSILGGFINGLFELSRNVYLPSEVIHMSVDYIYQYLSRVKDVPLNDIRLVTLGAIWVASKYEGLQRHREICRFTDCTPSQLKDAELRLLTVIDFNLTKPNAINFRNRYIVIESSTSIISHLSSFILDMTLHCYTIMILPSSKRAAAALWLARLIEKFQDIRLDDDDVIDLSNADLHEKMITVWPEHFHKLTGYHHSDIAQLAIRMHIVVLAFLCRGQQMNPSVNACYNKYSNDTYKNLTGSYEKFTSQIVYFGTELYCHMYNLMSSEWLEKNEYETLQTRYSSLKPYSYMNTQSGEHDIVSCPELSAKPLYRRVLSDIEQEAIVTSDKSKLLKLDSGYATGSN